MLWKSVPGSFLKMQKEKSSAVLFIQILSLFLLKITIWHLLFQEGSSELVPRWILHFAGPIVLLAKSLEPKDNYQKFTLSLKSNTFYYEDFWESSQTLKKAIKWPN